MHIKYIDQNHCDGQKELEVPEKKSMIKLMATYLCKYYDTILRIVKRGINSIVVKPRRDITRITK